MSSPLPRPYLNMPIKLDKKLPRVGVLCALMPGHGNELGRLNGWTWGYRSSTSLVVSGGASSFVSRTNTASPFDFMGLCERANWVTDLQLQSVLNLSSVGQRDQWDWSVVSV